MKTQKIIYASAIAVIFIIAMIVYKDTMTFTEISLAFIAQSATIGWVWKWITSVEEKKKRKDVEKSLEAYRAQK